jgi:23S rRNA (adenine2503-C2)-methyltransferase
MVEKNLQYKNAFYLPSGRIFLLETKKDKYPIECTEMRDVSVQGKEHYEVRTTQDPHIIWNHLKSYEEKWLLTVSTQKGCTHNCHFCDVSGLPFKGNLSQEEIENQVRFLLEASPYVTESEKVKIGFARMGEPAHNLENVLGAMRNLPKISREMNRDYNWLPCFNTIAPYKTAEGKKGFDVLDEVIDLKEKEYDGRLHLQISCNSTDEKQRRKLFGGAKVLTIEEVVKYINTKDLHNRTATLNFIVMKGIPVNVDYLMELGLNPEKFAVKLIPLNSTIKSQKRGLETIANYNNYEDLQKLGEKFKQNGIPVVIDAIAKCEEAGLCCGQLAHIFVNKSKEK